MSIEDQLEMLQVSNDEVTAVRQVFGLTESSMREGVDSLMEWFQKQPHLAHIDISRSILQMMIIVGKGSIERAKEKTDNFYKYRFLMAEMIQDRKEILCSPDKIWDSYQVFVLPKLLDNRRISIVKFEPEIKFSYTEFFRKVCLLLDCRINYDFMAGDIWIIDFKNVSFTQILAQNPLVLKRVAMMFTKGLNWRIYGIHCINLAFNTSIIQMILDFFTPYITSVIMDRIVVHNNVEGLYEYMPKECLPEDYGGNEMSSEKLTEIAENEYRKPKITEYLLKCSEMVSNESLRPRDENSEEFLAGSFRKLEVD